MDKNVNRNGIAGVSLVEIMISLVLVAFALIAITTVFPRIMGHRKGIAEAEQANIIAMEALEFLQWYECGSVNSGEGNSDFNGTYGTANPIIDMGSGSVAYTVTKGACAPDNGVNIITVEVTWKKSGKDHKVKMTGALR